MKQDLDFKNIVPALKASTRKVMHYSGLLFFMLIAMIYAFMLFRINVLSNAQPGPADVEQSTTQTLNVNKKVAEQLKQLEDNSVNVKSIFQDARNNPFQE